LVPTGKPYQADWRTLECDKLNPEIEFGGQLVIRRPEEAAEKGAHMSWFDMDHTVCGETLEMQMAAKTDPMNISCFVQFSKFVEWNPVVTFGV
jgi:hypothetical protein